MKQGKKDVPMYGEERNNRKENEGKGDKDKQQEQIVALS